MKNNKFMILVYFTILLFIIIIIFNFSNSMNKKNNNSKKLAESENELISIQVEVKENNDSDYKCLIDFVSNDENDKIKQIKYPGENNKIINIADNEGKEKVSLDYEIKKGEELSIFEVTTKSGKVISKNTGYKIIYKTDENSEEFATQKNLKSLETDIKSEYPLRSNYTFCGWSEEQSASEPGYFENGKYKNIENEDEITLYAKYEENNSGKTNNINNNALIGEISKINASGIQNITVSDEIYKANIIVINNDVVLDGVTDISGATLNNKVYEFGDKDSDVAKKEEDGSISDATAMVVLKVNGNLTVNSNVKLTACKSDNGYGGPKGFFIYCTGTIINNGIIDMTARGARAVGQNVYLWQNESEGIYEYVPKNGGTGGYSVTAYHRENVVAGIAGTDGTGRQCGGGRKWRFMEYFRSRI